MLSHDEQELYSRHLGIPGWGKETQDTLMGSKVFVAGAGGLGSPVLYYLAAAGVGNLVICDSDTVDISNLNRQILYKHAGIGGIKVDAAKKTITELNPYVHVTSIHKRIDARNAAELTSDADIIIDCLDNFETRLILNEVSVTKRIPMIHAGVSGLRGQITFLRPPHTPCLACFFDEPDQKGVKYVAGAAPGVLGSLQAVEAIKYLAGFGATLENRILFWDGFSMQFETVKLTRNPKCRVCRTVK